MTSKRSATKRPSARSFRQTIRRRHKERRYESRRKARPHYGGFKRYRLRDRPCAARQGGQDRDHRPASGRPLRRCRGVAQRRRFGRGDRCGCRHGGRPGAHLAASARSPRRPRHPGQQCGRRSCRASRVHLAAGDRGDAKRRSCRADPSYTGALPSLRASGSAMVVNVTSGIALIGAPFYATYAAAKAGLARFGEASRRELKGEGVHVLTVYPGGTDTPMMKTNRAGPELGFGREPAPAVADATIEGIETEAFEVIRGGETRAQMIALNRDNPAAIDERMLAMKPALEEAVKDHSAL